MIVGNHCSGARFLSSDAELKPERWVKDPLARAELASELDDDIEAAGAMDRRIVEQRKVVDTAKVRKDQATAEFDRQFVPIARLLEATFRVAGETELADRIRPTVRQLGRNDGQEEETAEPEAEAPEAAPESEPETVEESVTSAS